MPTKPPNNQLSIRIDGWGIKCWIRAHGLASAFAALALMFVIAVVVVASIFKVAIAAFFTR